MWVKPELQKAGHRDRLMKSVVTWDVEPAVRATNEDADVHAAVHDRRVAGEACV